MANEQPNYAAIVAEAEKAVAAVKDPELKQAAFTKVLDTILSAAVEHSDHGGRATSHIYFSSVAGV